MTKNDIVTDIKKTLASQNLHIVEENSDKPWGAYFRIDDADLQAFREIYFKGIELQNLDGASLSPKILLVEPDKRLSWQVHQRRAEVWRVVQGPVGVVLSETDDQLNQPAIFREGEVIEIDCGIRHRLVGLEEWGVVAEIWVHQEPDNLSDEDDIRRIEDDFGR